MGFDMEGGTSPYTEIERLRRSHDYWQTGAINWERKANRLEFAMREILANPSVPLWILKIIASALERGT